MSQALVNFGDRMLCGLTRAGIDRASRWAEQYRRGKNGTPWLVHGYAPWSLEWHDAKIPHGVILKAAQMCATESMLSRGMFANDVLKQDVLYVLPDWRPTASDFSAARFDAAVKSSPYLEGLYDRSNVGLKRTSVACFYIRGSRGRSGLKSIPTPHLFLDEVDEMEDAMIALAYERTSGQLEKFIWELSTPSIDEHGIDRAYKESTQEHYCFQCPSCSKWTEFSWTQTEPECLEIVGDDPNSLEVMEQSYLKCRECGNRIEHKAKKDFLSRGVWTPMMQNRSKRGFHINQLYSMTVSPGEVAKAFLKGRLNQADEQEFWNSKMGLPHTPKGAKLVDAEVRACIGGYMNSALPQGDRLVTMGIDVGRVCHYEIDEWDLGPANGLDINSNAKCRVLKQGRVNGFDELDTLMLQYRPTYCVIDAHPERRLSAQFANRFPGHVSMCIYGNGVSGKALHEHNSDSGEPLVTVDRSSWLDQALNRFRHRSITLPRDTSFEYVEHLTSIARIWERDQHGQPISRHVTPSGKADHHAHARNYAEIALALATGLREVQNMQSPINEDEY